MYLSNKFKVGFYPKLSGAKIASSVEEVMHRQGDGKVRLSSDKADGFV